MEDILFRFNPWWDSDFEFAGIPREAYLSQLLKQQKTKEVVLITGLRRVGKTTLLHQIIHRLLKKIEKNKVFYVSLDNLALKNHTILEIVDIYRRICSLKHNEHVFLFLDEVHFQNNYELQLKNLYDMGHCKIYASGSASLDIIMKSPYLTGRQRITRLAPLSFNEYLKFTNSEVTIADKHLYPSLAYEYVNIGGMPEYVNTKDPNVLQSLLDSVLYRDIAGRYNIRDRENLKDVLILIAQSVSSPISIRKISRVLGIKESTVSKILTLFVESNLLYYVEKEGKVSERKASPKKIYLADTGLFTALTDKVNFGAKVENRVYLTLDGTVNVRYHRFNGQEVDFVFNKKAYESKYKNNITSEDISAIKTLRGYRSKTVVSENVERKMEGINIVPLWKFLLNNKI
ncbi:MAG: ATP-binding protein [Thermoplasmata archaeon]|nr:MAG: ATP-binding protein [Thermoplasmata archaeon]